MSNLQFREDGPAKVSANEYAVYCHLSSNFDKGLFAGYRVWINENCSDGVRRLALRDIIRRGVPNVSRHFKFEYGDMLRVTAPTLEETLRFRPKLLRELREEFYYCLERGNKFYEPTADELIELILQLSSDEDGSQFWPYHSAAHKFEANNFKEPLALCLPGRNMPKWLQDKIWSKVIEQGAQDLQKEGTFTPLRTTAHTGVQYHQRVIERSYNYPSAGTVLELFYDFLEDQIPVIPNTRLSEQILRWLEDNLPDDVVYDEIVVDHAEQFKDLTLCCKVMRRYYSRAMPVDESKIGSLKNMLRESSIGFYFWLRGLITQLAPDDTDFLEVVDELIREKNQ